MTSTRAPLRITVIARGLPIASENIIRLQVLGDADRLAGHGQQQVPLAQAGPVGRAAGHDLRDEQAGLAAEPFTPDRGHRPRHHGQAQVGAADPAVLHQRRDDFSRGVVDRDGHTQADPGHGGC